MLVVFYFWFLQFIIFLLFPASEPPSFPWKQCKFSWINVQGWYKIGLYRLNVVSQMVVVPSSCSLLHKYTNNITVTPCNPSTTAQRWVLTGFRLVPTCWLTQRNLIGVGIEFLTDGVELIWGKCTVLPDLGIGDTDRWRINLHLCATCQYPLNRNWKNCAFAPK